MSLIVIVLAVVMGIYGARVQLIWDIRTQAIKAIHARIEKMLDDADSYDSWAALDEACRAEWDTLERKGFNGMIAALHKWTFAHFFPELAKEQESKPN